MKRSWLGLGMLLVLLAGGLLVTWAMGAVHDPIARDLTAAGEAALTADWDRAGVLLQRAGDAWEKHEFLRACFADHGPMEEIDACFAQLEIYGRMKEETAFAAACGETARKVTAMGEAHKLIWQNFF